MERRAPRISIHAPRVGGDMEKLKSKISNTISIHAPRVGGDSVRHFTLPGFHYFNPRPPCGGRRYCCHYGTSPANFNPRPPCGGRRISIYANAIDSIFQSTPPVWGATDELLNHFGDWANFNPRPPCGGRRNPEKFIAVGDYFNPRPPCGGRRVKDRLEAIGAVISIHAPRVGGDGKNS